MLLCQQTSKSNEDALPARKCNVTCPRFSYQASCSANLKTHLRKHTVTMLKCPHCVYETAYKGVLEAHIRKHNVLNCPHCPYETSYKNCLKAHIRKHTGDRLKCSHCSYETTREDNLKVHVRKHSGLKCPHCPFETAYYEQLRGHLRKHDGSMLKCPHCSFETTHNESLERHLKRHTELCWGVYIPNLVLGVLPYRPRIQHMHVYACACLTSHWNTSHLYTFIPPKDSIMISQQTMLFSTIELTLFFCGFSHLPNKEITNNLYIGDSVTLW